MTDTCVLLPGETVLEQVQRVTNVMMLLQHDRAVQGVLNLTSYQLIFASYNTSWPFGSFTLPLSAINTITRDGFMILITCKDFRTLRLAMHDVYPTRRDANPQWLDLLVRCISPPNMVGAVFAFDYFAEKKTRMMLRTGTPEDGWYLYSPIREFQRLGFVRNSTSLTNPETDPMAMTWRLVKNSKFRFSPTYPQLMIVPSIMTEEQLVQSARFRDHGRFPVPVWRHPINNCVLVRSSQPNFGIVGNRSEPDRILVKAYRDAATKNSSGESPRLHIMDARALLASTGNYVKGKGVEKSQHYDNAIVERLGIANIHKMRESLDALNKLVQSDRKNFYNRLSHTKWLKHLVDILKGARRIAKILQEDGASVLVHGSDGWDRTSQLVSLAQLILDPYYRTIHGFGVLIEKEWCGYGHKFADRIGVGKDATDVPNERSPVMFQFLDCVWQIMRQFPTAFEFNEKFLLHIWDSLISGLYGTFLYNTERERIFDKVWERTESVWTPVLENPRPYKNPMYGATNVVLYPRTDEASIVLWEGLVFRWDVDPLRDLAQTDDCVDADWVDTLISNVNQSRSGETSEPNPYPDDRRDDSQETIEFGDITRVLEEEEFTVAAQERSRQRKLARMVRDALTAAPEESRIKYLEQMLNDSFARELELENHLRSVRLRDPEE